MGPFTFGKAVIDLEPMETVDLAARETPKNLQSRSRGWKTFALRAMLTISILAALFFWLPADELWMATKKTGIALWGFTLFCVCLVHIMGAWKWIALVVASGLQVKWLEGLRAHVVGLFANIWLPSLTGGDVVRLGLITKSKKQIAFALTGSVADRANDVVALLLLTAVGILWLPVMKEKMGTEALASITILVVSGLLSAPAFLKYVQAGWFPPRIARGVTALKIAVSAMLSQKKVLVLTQLLSLLIQGSFVLFNAAIGQAMGIQIPLAAWFFAWPLAKLAAMAPVSLGGLGVREAAMAALLAAFYVDPTLSVAQSLVWESIVLAQGLLAGTFSLWLGRILRLQKTNSSQIKNSENEVAENNLQSSYTQASNGSDG